MLSQNPVLKSKYSKNRIFVTSHFGTLLFCNYVSLEQGPMGAYPREALICKSELLGGGLVEGTYLEVGDYCIRLFDY